MKYTTHIMRNLKISLLLTLGIGIFSGCKKDSNSTVMTDDDDTCIQRPTSMNGTLIDGKYIIAYNSSSGIARGTDQQRVEDISLVTLSRNNIREGSLEQSFSGEPGGFVARLTPDEVARLRQDPTISMIEQDRIISLGTCFTVVSPRLVTWNVTRVGYGDGTGKTAWIIDSGIDFTHPDLTVDSSRSRSFITGVSSPRDENGHGTHVAGIIGGKNNTIGVLGVASGAKLVALRVLDKDGTGTLSAIIQALAYVSNVGKAGDVVNMSVGDDEGTSDILDQQVKSTASRGIYVTIAAGNEETLANKYSSCPGKRYKYIHRLCG